MMVVYILVFTAILCAAIAAVLACIPGLHIYNLLGLFFWGYYQIMHTFSLPAEWLATGTVAMISAYTICNTIPAVLLAAPDESALHTVLPGQKLLLVGRGREAVMLTAYGGACALMVLLICSPLMPRILPMLYRVTKDHSHWMIWSIIAFMLLSEWPKPIPPGLPPWQRLWLANKAATIGLVVFILSGVLGFMLFFQSPLSSRNAFQSLIPAFVGLFTLPGLLTNIWTDTKPPAQNSTPADYAVEIPHIRQGILAGVAGGAFAAFVPVITGGIGGMLAGHATAIKNRYAFLVSQGASKTMYYTGGVILFFIPNLYLSRGGGAAMLRACVSPYPAHLYWMVIAAAVLGGAIALCILPLLTNLALKISQKWGYRNISIISAIFIVILVTILSGVVGLGVMLVATGIGILPILYGTRRMNALGVILLPVACSMSGIAPAISHLVLLQ